MLAHCVLVCSFVLNRGLWQLAVFWMPVKRRARREDSFCIYVRIIFVTGLLQSRYSAVIWLYTPFQLSSDNCTRNCSYSFKNDCNLHFVIVLLSLTTVKSAVFWPHAMSCSKSTSISKAVNVYIKSGVEGRIILAERGKVQAG